MKTKSGVLLFALTVLFLCTAHSSRGTPHAAPAAEAKKVIIDTDPGTDDAMAILLALNSPELDVKAITVVPGNVPGKLGLENALKLVSLATAPDTHANEFGSRDFREAMLGDLAKVIPDGVSRVIPADLRLIPRSGAPSPVDVWRVPAELQELVKTE